MKELSVLSVCLQDLFVQCLFLCKPLIMKYKDDRHVLSVATDEEASRVCPRHAFNYLMLVNANLGQDESLGLFKDSNTHFSCWLEWKEYWSGDPEIGLVFRFNSIPANYVVFRKPLYQNLHFLT